MDAEQVGTLRPALGALLRRFKECFATVNTFNHLERYVCGLMTDVERKCVEPIALAAKVPVRTLQEFLSHARWDEHRVHNILQQVVVDGYDCDHAIGVIDGCGHSKKGDKTPGVQRQWCGETGKIDNCIVGQHLIYTDNDPHNPFTCLLASDLFLPKSWSEDRPRCREAHIPDHVVHQPKWGIAIDQLAEALGNGVRLSWVTFDEEYGMVPAFWRGLDTLGQRAIGEVPSNFYCWPTVRVQPCAMKSLQNCRFSAVFSVLWLPPSEPPAFLCFYVNVLVFTVFTGCFSDWRSRPLHSAEVLRPTYPSCHSPRGPHAAKRVDNTCERSPIFRGKAWKRMRIKRTTWGYSEWDMKAARVHLVDTIASTSRPTDRKYWLIVARSTQGKKETKYFVSNASASCTLEYMMTAAWARWHVEKWFERAKRETGFGAFEPRTYHGLLRHWLCSRIAMFFLAAQTKRLRGEKPAHHIGAGQQDCRARRTQNLEIPVAVNHGHAQDSRVLPVA